LSEAILLVGHGSRDPEGNAEFLRFTEAVRRSVENRIVEPCFIELAKPNVQEGIEICVTKGAKQIIVLPVILFAASHVKVDLPYEVDIAREKYPEVKFYYGRHFGVNPLILEILDEIIEKTKLNFPFCNKGDTAILIVGRGSSDPDANSDLYKMARILWERKKFKYVEVCFIGVTFPDFYEGVRRCVSLGARCIVVLPYFLFTGVLIKRIKQKVFEMKSAYPEVDFVLCDYLGTHPKLVKVIVERADEAVKGVAFMNCEMCKYRVGFSLKHHESNV
jgi:sirohydrochlorin cobaltochelatase